MKKKMMALMTVFCIVFSLSFCTFASSEKTSETQAPEAAAEETVKESKSETGLVSENAAAETDNANSETEKAVAETKEAVAETDHSDTETEKASAEIKEEPASETKAESTEKEKKAAGKIVILATGGTIAGVGDAGKTAGYKPGSLTAEDLISAVPELEDLAELEAIQVCNVNSDDMTDEIWLELAKTINEKAQDPEVTGFVITHGTDTMEETAYYLNLAVKTDKPVVLTGSMRPATSISADGPMNLYEAASVAASEEAKGKGVLVVFSDRIYSARSVTKTSTYHVTAIASGEMGAIGVVRDGEVFLYESPAKLHTNASEFDVSGLEKLPDISILYFAVDSDTELLTFAAEHSEGLVIAGAGAGEFSEEYKKIIEGLKIPVVISSRIDDGIILPENLLCENTIAADNLSPQKAAILLRLALTKTTDRDEIQKMFFAY